MFSSSFKSLFFLTSSLARMLLLGLITSTFQHDFVEKHSQEKTMLWFMVCAGKKDVAFHPVSFKRR
jgi:hypothetical protein